MDARRVARRWGAWAGFAIIALLIEVGHVSADPFGGCNGVEGCQADNAGHRYCYGSGFDADLEPAADHAMNISLDGDTDVYDIFDGSCSTATDVKWSDVNFGPFDDTRGSWGCLNPVSPDTGDICFRGQIFLDPEEIDKGTEDDADRRKTACHEAGHSVGLEHGDNKIDCMIIGEIPAPTGQWKTYSGHHINDHINPTY